MSIVASITKASPEIAEMTAKIAAEVARFAGDDVDFTITDEEDEFNILTDEWDMTVRIVSIAEDGIDFDIDYQGYYNDKVISEAVLADDEKDMFTILTTY